MSVRNFWIETDIDGRSTRLTGGPRGKDGGFRQTIYIRDEGGITRAVDIGGYAREGGSLELYVTPLTGLEAKPDGDGFTITVSRDPQPATAGAEVASA